MQIDWLTVAAQIVNFLVLVWLLKRFLYGPVIAAMESREHRIQARLDSAEKRERDAQEEAARFRSQQHDLDLEREDILASARREADEIRHKLKQEAGDEVDRQRRRWLQELEAEQEHILADISRQVSRQVAHAARRALIELADTDLETQMVRHFLKRLRELDEHERQDLAQALAGDDTVVVASAFDLPEKLRSQIEVAVTSLLGKKIPVRFDQLPELACGLQLAASGRTIGWNIADYLAGLEQDLESSLRPPSREA
jgi:F-type H+-transporting ATPase subunit b